MQKTFFIDIDGTILHQKDFELMNQCDDSDCVGSLTDSFQVAVNRITEWFNEGHHIVMTTARPEELREFTVKQLAFIGLPYNQLVMGIGRSTRVLINNTSESNPDEPRAQAYQVFKNDPNAFNLIDE